MYLRKIFIYIYIFIVYFFPCYSVCAEDSFEPDDSRQLARSISVGGFPRQQDFHSSEDEDWVLFWGSAGKSYTIHANNQGEADIVIEVFSDADESFSDRQNEEPIGGNEKLQFDVGNDGEGVYFARISLYEKAPYSTNNGYWLTVYHPNADETITVSGYVKEEGNRSVDKVLVLSSNGEGYVTESDGYYQLNFDPIPFCLETRPICGRSKFILSSCERPCRSTAPSPGDDIDEDINMCSPNLEIAIKLLHLIAGKETDFFGADICDLTNDKRLGLEEAVYVLQKVAQLR
jgi:hypothetical protein